MKKGFTLIELLIVITIIGILAVAFLPSILGAPAKARDVARIGHLNQIATAIEAYASQKGYPKGAAGPAVYCVRAASTWGSTAAFVDIAKNIQGGKYPQDPSGTVTNVAGIGACTAGEYVYVKLRKKYAPAQYALIATMEDESNGNKATISNHGTSNDGAWNTEAKGKYYMLVK